MSAVASHLRPHMFVRTSSQATATPMTRARAMLPSAMTSVLPRGSQKIEAALDEKKTRHR